MTTPATTLDLAVADAARRLEVAISSRTPCAPVRELLPAGDIPAAYSVQSALVAARLLSGACIVGRKIGLTNPAVQSQLGVDQPDFGVLFDDMKCAAGESIDPSRLLQPRIEAEIAFVLGADLDAPSIDARAVSEATAQVVVALEIVDSRIADWDITIVDTIADNASSGLFVLGDEPRPLADLDLAAVSMSLHRGEELVSSGAGRDCLGSPLAAMAWLANTAREYGQPLRAGDVVLSGALGPVVPVRPGDTFTADVSDLGTVTAQFAAQPVAPSGARP
jgi:2-keto-4-pentenoate hydratase